MMTTRCFTSFTLGYLDKAKVLLASVRAHHPDWEVTAMLVEPPSEAHHASNAGFDRVITLEQLMIPGLAGWMFMHDIVEACTGVKGAALLHLLECPDTDAVVYLDPDVELFGPLTAVEDALSDSSIVLTPHQLVPEPTPRGVVDNEMTSLVHGIFNLGFLAVRSDAQGLAFARWWRERLVDHCFDDRASGLFTDQRWCDFIPALFDRHVILRDPGYNLGPWNISQRDVTRSDDGEHLVVGRPLRLLHFSGAGGGGRRMLERYAHPDSAVFELWADYERRTGKRPDVPPVWLYGHFDDGTPISTDMRAAYRFRPDIRAQFPDPWRTDSAGCFLDAWGRGIDFPATTRGRPIALVGSNSEVMRPGPRVALVCTAPNASTPDGLDDALHDLGVVSIDRFDRGSGELDSALANGTTYLDVMILVDGGDVPQGTRATSPLLTTIVVVGPDVEPDERAVRSADLVALVGVGAAVVNHIPLHAPVMEIPRDRAQARTRWVEAIDTAVRNQRRTVGADYAAFSDRLVSEATV